MTPLNKIILCGRITSDPELKQTRNGKSSVYFNVAVRRSYKDANGEYPSDFVPCQAWGKLAETISTYFAKGSEIGISGSWASGSYKDKDGRTVYTNVCNVSEISFGEKNKHSPAARGESVTPALPSGGGDIYPGDFEEVIGDGNPEFLQP